MNKLLNPRGYLSHTQIDMWENNPKKYIRKYIYGEADYTNDRMEFGSYIDKIMEQKEEPDDELLKLLRSAFPRYGKFQHEIRVELKTDSGIVILLGMIDDINEKTLDFRERKTGVTAWTQSRSDNSNQILHYFSMVWLKYKKIPDKAYLDWAETEITDDHQVRLTGRLETFEVKKTLADILEYLSKVARVAREIDNVYREELEKLS